VLVAPGVGRREGVFCAAEPAGCAGGLPCIRIA
jgi:hypothetical protein